MQKEGKKTSITVFYSEKVTIDHRTTKLRKAKSGETESLKLSIAELSDQESGSDDLAPTESRDSTEDFE